MLRHEGFWDGDAGLQKSAGLESAYVTCMQGSQLFSKQPGIHLKIMQTVDAHSLPSLVSHFAGGQHIVRANRVCITVSYARHGKLLQQPAQAAALQVCKSAELDRR